MNTASLSLPHFFPENSFVEFVVKNMMEVMEDIRASKVAIMLFIPNVP